MVRILRKLDSDNLHLPEIKPLLGRLVEITVEEHTPAVRDEFYAESARLPETEEAFEAQKGLFRSWRNEPRFEAYWSVLDSLLERSYDHVRKWIVAAEAVAQLEDYDFDAYRQQREYDRQHIGSSGGP
jgi:hypothetical protein